MRVIHMTFTVYRYVHMHIPNIYILNVCIYFHFALHTQLCIFMYTVCICMRMQNSNACMYALASSSSHWYSMYTYVQVYTHVRAHTLLQGTEPQPASRRDSIDSQVSTAHSEQAQSLQRAGSKGLGSRRPSKASSSRRRALGGGSSKTRSKCASSQHVALEQAQLCCQAACEAARHGASV